MSKAPNRPDKVLKMYQYTVPVRTYSYVTNYELRGVRIFLFRKRNTKCDEADLRRKNCMIFDIYGGVNISRYAPFTVFFTYHASIFDYDGSLLEDFFVFMLMMVPHIFAFCILFLFFFRWSCSFFFFFPFLCFVLFCSNLESPLS